MEHGSRTRLMTATVHVVVFGAGIMLGVAADGTLSATTPDEVVAVDEQPEEEAPRRRTPMYEQVGPDDEQGALIEAIVLEHRAHMDALHDEFRSAYNPRYQALIEDTREAILGVLTPDQAAQYQELLDGWDRRRTERNEKKDRD